MSEKIIDPYASLTPFCRPQQNWFSYWFPKIKDCGIKVPKSLIFKTPQEMYVHFYMEHPSEDLKAIQKWAEEEMLPRIKAEKMGLLFVKNSTFSNKFNATDCMILPEQLAWSIANINYQALCVDANGDNEFIVRERIGYDRRKTPCIYHGLPLRPEFRAFYDFSERKSLFCVNYWDYDYVASHLYEATDKIIFDYERERIEQAFNERKSEVIELVAQHMKNVEGLEGPWSVDILLDEHGTYWLIDMAVAEQSAYWELRPGNEAALTAKKAEAAKLREAYSTSV